MLSQRPKRISGYDVEEIDGELLIFNPSAAKVLHTNQTGALVWGMCTGEHTVGEIVQLLTALYPNSAEIIANDVPNILTSFADECAIMWT